ncbi:MAG: 16S rRNA (guanine(966)-N(2))-methyltransferase RsmD [Kineosporiaceae bacterium]
MTRIIAGTAGGRRLATPRGTGTRPTSDRVREALFSGLDARGALRGARVLDLYAGSGALGLEAASRGAASVVLVDSSREAAGTARRNVTAVGLPGVTVMHTPVLRYLRRAAGSAAFDLVLADPPYPLGEDDLAEMLGLLAGAGAGGDGADDKDDADGGDGGDGGVLAVGGLVVVERSARSPEPAWPDGLVGLGVRRYGETVLWTAQRAGDGTGNTAGDGTGNAGSNRPADLPPSG